MEPEDTPVLRMRLEPQVEQLPNGEWQASYPGVGWSVTAASRQAAVTELQAEDQRRVESDPSYREFLFQLAQHNLTDPAPGVETEQISRSEYWQRTGGRERMTFERDTPADD